MKSDRTSFLAPGFEARPESQTHGRGVYAVRDASAERLVAVWGGRIVRRPALDRLSSRERALTLQVEEGLYLAPVGTPDPADLVNHSCEPNAGLRGQVCLVTMCPVAAGEEIRFDYAMSEGSSYDEFDCSCGTSPCRGRVAGEDWRRPDLQERYEGYFSSYLERRIAALR